MVGPRNTLYTPLDPAGGIRILVLKAGPNSSEIDCELVPENLNQNPKFEALSYEWGPAEDPKTIKVNGVTVLVRQNLWWALWYLRKGRRKERRMWIDALCINQDDKDERGHQVAFMGSIYDSAHVICWLGRGNVAGGCERAMEYLERVIELCEDGPETFGPDSRWACISPGFQVGLLGDEPSSRRLFDILEGANPQDELQVEDKLKQRSFAHHRMLNEFSREKYIRVFYEFGPRNFSTYAPIPLVRTSKSSLDNYGASQDGIYRDIEILCQHSYWRRTWIIQEIVLGKGIVFCLGDRCIDGGALFLVAKSILLRSITEESLLMLDAFRIFALRIGRLLRRDMPLVRLMEISERSSCQDPRDKVFAMLGLASDCQHGELMPDYGKSTEAIYQDVVVQHYGSGNRNCWLVVHSSSLLQRAFWPLSYSLIASEASDANARWSMVFKVNGLCIGSVADTGKPGPHDMMWWSHPGLVKPITSDLHSLPLHRFPMPPSSYFQQFSTFSSPWLWLSSWFRQILFPSPPSSKPLDLNPIRRLSLNPVFMLLSSVYGPLETQHGDLVVRFLNSNITAILRREPNGYILVGRGMVLDGKGDLDTFHEGQRTLTSELLKSGSIVEVFLSGTDLRRLTSPHY